MMLHPGAVSTLKSLIGNELDVARLMQAGEVSSPQRIGALTLFDLRITGTGLAFRQGLREHVWRDPRAYLTADFLARCAGLPVILEHPSGQTMTSEDYADRNIGSVFLPYIKGDEVWGIARIYDASAADLMEGGGLSTSPCVVFRDASVNDRLTGEDGTSILFEGVPSLVDHLALCERGVWDKSGGPMGVRSDSERKIMADEDKGGDDTSGDDRMGKILGHLGSLADGMKSMGSRLDALESKGAKTEEGDKSATEELAEDRKEKEREEAKDDSKRADSFARRRADDAALAKVQARADAAFNAHGKRAPMPLVGETPLRYRVRMAGELRRFSPALEKVNLDAIAHADEAGFSELEDRIYADSDAEAARPTQFPDGEIQKRTRFDRDMQRNVNEYFGPHTYLKAMGLEGRKVVRINTPANNPAAFLGA